MTEQSPAIHKQNIRFVDILISVRCISMKKLSTKQLNKKQLF